MLLLNFKSFKEQNSIEQNLELIEEKQRKILQKLRKEYEELLQRKSQRKASTAEFLQNVRHSYTFKLPIKLKNIVKEQQQPKVKSVKIPRKSIFRKSTADAKQRPHSVPLSSELHKRKTLFRKYTFKLPLNASHERGDNENHEIFKNRSIQPPPSVISPVGKPYTMKYRNNFQIKPMSLRDETIVRLKLARALGNRYSKSFKRFTVFIQPQQKSKLELHSVKMLYQQFIHRKEKMELKYTNSVKFNRKLPKEFIEEYFELIDKVCYYEDLYDFKASGWNDNFACQEILQLNSRPEADQSMINELNQPNFHQLKMIDSSRQNYRAIATVGIDEILLAAKNVSESIERTLKEGNEIDLFPFNDEIEVKTANEEIEAARDETIDDEEMNNQEKEQRAVEVIKSTLFNIPDRKSFSCDSLTVHRSNSECMMSCDSFEENADNRVKLLPSHEICKCDETTSLTTSSVFYTASEDGGGGASSTNIIMGTKRECNELDNHHRYDNECTNEYSNECNVERIPSMEMVENVINYV